MAKKFLTDINLSQNELQNAAVQNLSTAPANGVAGQIYYNTTDKTMYQHDGTSWKPMGERYTAGNGITITNPSTAGDPKTIAADFATQAEAEAGTSTTKVMSPKTVKDMIDALDTDSSITLAELVEDENDDITGIKINGIREQNGIIYDDVDSALTVNIDPSHPYDDSTSPLATVGTVSAAQAAAVAAGVVSVSNAAAADATNITSYNILQNGNVVGTINIPKFLVVKSGSVVTGTWSGNTFTEDDPQPGSGTGKAIKLVINDSADAGTDDDVLYINVADLVDTYTAGAGITVTPSNVVKAKMVTETNGSVASESPSSTAGRQYPVVPDSSGNLSVNVPWTNTVQTNAEQGYAYAVADRYDASGNAQGFSVSYSPTRFSKQAGGIVAVKFNLQNFPTDNIAWNLHIGIDITESPIYYKGAAITDGIIQNGDTALMMYDGTRYHVLAVDRLCKDAVTGVAWQSGNKHVTLTFADGSTSNVTIHPTNTAYIASGTPGTGEKLAIPSANQTPSFGGKFNIPQVVTDSFGHVTDQNEMMVTIPNNAATTSAAGLMSAADKTKLNAITRQVRQFSKTNAALTYNSTTGTCVWTITPSSLESGLSADMREAILSLRDSNGDEVFADTNYAQGSITVTIKASATIAAGTYVANILVPVAL